MWEKIEWFGDLAKRSPESVTLGSDVKTPESKPYTADGIKGLLLFIVYFVN